MDQRPTTSLNRLAIHATAKRTDLAPDDGLALIEQHCWLYAHSLKHETFALLERVFPNASDRGQRRFIAHSMAAPVVEDENTDAEAKRVADYERYNLAVWLHRIAPNSTAAAEHFDLLQQQNPGVGPRDHPDMDRWISAGFRGPRSPITTEELLTKTPTEAATYVVGYAPEGPGFDRPDRYGLLTIFEKAIPQNVNWSIAIANELVVRNEWKADVWLSLLAAWRSADLDYTDWRIVVELLDGHTEIVASGPMAVANFLDQSIRRNDLEPGDVDRLERIGERVLAESEEAVEVDAEAPNDWLTSAISHPAGQVALTWLRALSLRMEAAGDTWEGIPTPQRQRFEALVGGDGKNALMARVSLASQVHFLFSADRAWTETNVIPLFDWAADAERAAQAWDGFLTWGQWNEALFKEMEPFVRQTFTRMNELGGDAEAFVTHLAAVAAFSPADPWRAGGWLFDFIRLVAPEQRGRWAEQFARYAESLTPDGGDSLWDRWLSAYWDDRITGLPQPLHDSERQAMVSWIVPLRSRATAVVDRILNAAPQRVDHYTFYRLDQSELGTSHGAEIGRLLRGLLHGVQAVDYDTGEVLKLATAALEGGAAADDLVAVADEMARLGLPGADHLRALVNPADET